MDAADVFTKVFDPLVEKENLSLQLQKYEAAHKFNQQIEERLGKLEQENNELTQRLLDLNSESLEHFENLKLLNQSKQTSSIKISADSSFNINRAITGYAYVHESWNSEHQVKLITFYYNENCYIRIAISSSGLMDLIEIVPNHQNFLNIRKFLLMSQDVAGLLAPMLKYFKIMEGKHKISINES